MPSIEQFFYWQRPAGYLGPLQWPRDLGSDVGGQAVYVAVSRSGAFRKIGIARAARLIMQENSKARIEQYCFLGERRALALRVEGEVKAALCGRQPAPEGSFHRGVTETWPARWGTVDVSVLREGSAAVPRVIPLSTRSAAAREAPAA